MTEIDQITHQFTLELNGDFYCHTCFISSLPSLFTVTCRMDNWIILGDYQGTLTIRDSRGFPQDLKFKIFDSPVISISSSNDSTKCSFVAATEFKISEFILETNEKGNCIGIGQTVSAIVKNKILTLSQVYLD